MNIIGFLDQPTSGQYLLEGINGEHLSRDELAERGRRGPDFVRKHHSGPLLARRLIEMYRQDNRPLRTQASGEK
jgi:ABC-type lipoprotein export system ATPase subunit